MPRRNILIIILAIAGVLLSSLAAARLGVSTRSRPDHAVQRPFDTRCETEHYLAFHPLPEADNRFNALAIDPCGAR